VLALLAVLAVVLLRHALLADWLVRLRSGAAGWSGVRCG
jgi:hypothetical protein